MRFCPRCGSEVGDSDAFCEKCGARLDSMPQVPPQGPSATNGSKSLMPLLLIVLSVIALTSILVPYLMQPEEYTYTITVDEIGIDCSTDYVYSDANGDTTVFLKISSGGDEVESQKWKVKVNKGNLVLSENNTCKFRTSSENSTFSIFLMYRTGTSAIGAVDDMADLYDVSTYVKDVSIMPEIAGVSGISVTYESFKGGELSLKGDSDPKGILKLSISRDRS